MRLLYKVLIAAITFLIVVGSVVYFGFIYSPLIENKVVIIQKNARTMQIASYLHENQVIHNKFAFYAAAGLFNLKKKYIQPGEYEIPAKSNVLQVLKKLQSGERVVRKITFPEGMTNKQVIELLDKTEGFEGRVEIMPEEGSLLPDTFQYYYGDQKQPVVDQMQRNMIAYLATIPTFLDQRTLITVASLVEKETQLDHERPLVAAVYLNRLKLNMPLQADPTIIYGLSDGWGTLNRKVAPSDLKVDNPYNTYIYGGLPPTPIANPGKASIYATAFPADVKYLYFVADGKGGHQFANNFSQHIRNIEALRRFLANQKEVEKQ